MTFDDPTLYARDEDEEFGDTGAYSESLEEDFEEEEEEEEESGLPASEADEPEPVSVPAPPPPGRNPRPPLRAAVASPQRKSQPRGNRLRKRNLRRRP